MSYSDFCGYSQIQHKFTQTWVKIKSKERKRLSWAYWSISVIPTIWEAKARILRV